MNPNFDWKGPTGTGWNDEEIKELRRLRHFYKIMLEQRKIKQTPFFEMQHQQVKLRSAAAEYLHELDLHDSAVRIDCRSLQTITQGLGFYLEENLEAAKILQEEQEHFLQQKKAEYMKQEAALKIQYEEELKQLQEKANELEKQACELEEKAASIAKSREKNRGIEKRK